MKKLTYEYVKEQIEKTGYKLLSKKYVNARQKLNCICPRGHKYSVTWDNWQRGHECPCRSNKIKPTVKFIRSEFAKENYILLTNKYINNRQELEYRCPKGHEHSISWHNWKTNKQRCPFCSKYNNKYTIEFIRDEFDKEGYKLLTTKYMNNKQKLEYCCPKKHRYNICWNNWQQGERCPTCNANSFSSKTEREIANIIEVQGIKIKRNDRTQIINPLTSNRLELDIWIPSLNKAIEFNGKYWHSFEDNITRDKIKLKQCIKKNIELLVINEKNWINNKACCINEIKNFVKDKTILSYSETT